MTFIPEELEVSSGRHEVWIRFSAAPATEVQLLGSARAGDSRHDPIEWLAPSIQSVT